jgi:hypothetical protein
VDASLRHELNRQIERLTGGEEAPGGGQGVREALALDEERFRRLLRRFDLDLAFRPTGNDSPATGGP